MASRVRVALIALAFVLSSLAGVVHQSTTRHVQCAEHGDQIHSGAAATEAAPARDASVGDQRTTAIHGHEHCLIASVLRASRIAPSTPAIADAPVATGDQALAAPRVASAHRDHVYRTAPKTSPPA
jgi:hypothetical protein